MPVILGKMAGSWRQDVREPDRVMSMRRQCQILVLALLLPVSFACSADGKPGESAQTTGTLSVTMTLDHSGCVEDPHDHVVTLTVSSEPDHVTAATTDISFDVATPVILAPGLYQAAASSGWRPDSTNGSNKESACGCYGTINGKRDEVQLDVGDIISVVIPITCGTSSPE